MYLCLSQFTCSVQELTVSRRNVEKGIDSPENPASACGSIYITKYSTMII